MQQDFSPQAARTDQATTQATSTTAPIVEIQHLVKTFGKVKAIDDLSLTINTGETYGLIGPNGSGKTTLIRILSGLVKPTSGTVAIMRHRVADARIAGSIGYMTQQSALYNDLTAQQNLEFFCGLYGVRGQLRKERCREVLQRVDLLDRAHSLVDTFSGGMKQRLSLACALVHHPRLLFLDEPTVGVDPELRLSFWHYFAQLNQEGVTIIVSTHHLDEAAHCTRLGLLRFGLLIAEGTPQELLLRAGKTTMEDAFLYFATRETGEVTR